MSVVVAWVLCGSAVLSAYQIIRVAQQQIVQTHNHSVAVVLLNIAKQWCLMPSQANRLHWWQGVIARYLPYGQASLQCVSHQCIAKVTWLLVRPYSLQISYYVS